MTLLDASLIADLPPFVGMAHDDLKDLVSQATSARIAKDASVFIQGEKPNSFFLLLDGNIKVVRTTPDGEQVVARYLSAGELFGIAVALGLESYPASAVAARDCVFLSWPNRIWDTIIVKYPTFRSNSYKVVGERLQDTQERIVEMVTEKVEQRVATALLKLIKQTGKKTESGVLIDFPITRKDISELTGTTHHTVSRLMSAWENAGIIESGRQKIIVVDGHKLMLIAERNT